MRDYLDVSTVPRIVARCEKCKRDFLSLPTGAMIDRYAPKKWSGAAPLADGSCGGIIAPTSHNSPAQSGGLTPK